MAIKKLLLFTLLLCQFCLACRKGNSGHCNQQAVTENNIAGNWQQVYSIPTELGFVAPTRFTFTFSHDSFRLSLIQYSDIIADSNGCGYLEWEEFMKGNWQVSNGKLFIQGIFTEADYSEKVSGCYRKGAYIDSFSTYMCNDTLMLEWLNPKALTTEKSIKMVKR